MVDTRAPSTTKPPHRLGRGAVSGVVTAVERYLPALAWASLVANVLIIVTGGAVRLSDSGLGCPTWPRCTDGSLVAHREYGVHQYIEFGNRMLTFALVVVAVATLVAAWRTQRRWAVLLLLGIPAQAVIGGISVLTELNPWVVSLHLLVSMAMVCVAVHLVRRLRVPAARRLRGALPGYGLAVFASAWSVLLAGTVVTGAGPHAGAVHSHRNGLGALQTSQAHADLVFLLVGLTVGLVVVLRLPFLDAGAEARRAATTLLVVELAQGVVGFVQYFTHLPVALVGVHILGAALVAAAATWAMLAVVAPQPAPTEAVDGLPDDRRATSPV